MLHTEFIFDIRPQNRNEAPSGSEEMVNLFMRTVGPLGTNRAGLWRFDLLEFAWNVCHVPYAGEAEAMIRFILTNPGSRLMYTEFRSGSTRDGRDRFEFGFEVRPQRSMSPDSVVQSLRGFRSPHLRGYTLEPNEVPAILRNPRYGDFTQVGRVDVGPNEVQVPTMESVVVQQPEPQVTRVTFASASAGPVAEVGVGMTATQAMERMQETVEQVTGRYLPEIEGPEEEMVNTSEVMERRGPGPEEYMEVTTLGSQVVERVLVRTGEEYTQDMEAPNTRVLTGRLQGFEIDVGKAKETLRQLIEEEITPETPKEPKRRRMVVGRKRK